MAALFFAIASFLVFPTHPLHVSSRIDRGELPGVAAFGPWLRLAAPGCLLGEAFGGLSGGDQAPASLSCTGMLAVRGPWRSVGRSARIPATTIDSIDRSNTRRLGAVH